MEDVTSSGMNPALKIILIVAGIICTLTCVAIGLSFWLVKGSAHLGLGQLQQAEMAFDAAQGLTPGAC